MPLINTNQHSKIKRNQAFGLLVSRLSRVLNQRDPFFWYSALSGKVEGLIRDKLAFELSKLPDVVNKMAIRENSRHDLRLKYKNGQEHIIELKYFSAGHRFAFEHQTPMIQSDIRKLSEDAEKLRVIGKDNEQIFLNQVVILAIVFPKNAKVRLPKYYKSLTRQLSEAQITLKNFRALSEKYVKRNFLLSLQGNLAALCPKQVSSVLSRVHQPNQHFLRFFANVSTV